MKLPKLIPLMQRNKKGEFTGFAVTKKELNGELSEEQAAEVIRRAEAYKKLIKLLRYFVNLPCTGVVYDEHQTYLNDAEQALKVQNEQVR